MYNSATLIGRLCADPESKQANENTLVGNFRIAVDGGMIKGEKATEFLSIVCFNKTAENVCKFLSKGSLCQVVGRISTSKWEDKDGNKHNKTEIIANSVLFLDPAKKDSTFVDHKAHAGRDEPDMNVPF